MAFVKTNADRIKRVTLVLDTSAYAQNDVMAITAEITNAVPDLMSAILTSIRLVDKEKANRALQLWFLDANTSIGTLNAGESASDAASDDVLTIVSFAATDYIELANFSLATKSLIDTGMGIMLIPAKTAGTARNSSLYIAAKYTDATGDTYAATDIVLKIGLMVS